MKMPIDEVLLRVEDAAESDEEGTLQPQTLRANGSILHAVASTASGAPLVMREIGDAGGADASPLPPSFFEFDETSALLLDLDLDSKDMSLILDDFTGEDGHQTNGDGGDDSGPSVPVESGLSISHVGVHATCGEADNLQRQTKFQSTATPVALCNELSSSAPQGAFKYKGRKNVKLELAYLRQQVQELEEQLGDLQHAAAGDSTAKVASSSSTSSALNPVWEQIAQRQKDEKQKAELENTKLREALQGQLKIASSLERILRKRPNALWLETFELNTPDKKRFRLEGESDATEPYAILSEQIADLYAQLDDVLAETGLTDKTHEVRDVQVKSDANDHIFMELIDSKILPFDVSVSSAAVWKVAGISRTKLRTGYYGAIDSTDNTVHSQVSITLHLRRAHVLIRANMAIRKIAEAERVVMLWSSMGISEGSLLGSHQIKIRESGWAVMKPVAPDSTLLQVVVRVAPELCHSVSAQDHQQAAGVLTDLMMGSYHQNMKAIHQLIENSLLTEAGNQA